LTRGIPVHIVAARLGHTSPVTTMRVYAHVLPKSDVQAVELVGALLAR
jgi:integrase